MAIIEMIKVSILYFGWANGYNPFTNIWTEDIQDVIIEPVKVKKVKGEVCIHPIKYFKTLDKHGEVV